LRIGGPTPPEWVLRQPAEKIDETSFKLITKTLGEWERLGRRKGKYKNPETGEYTMVDVMVCAACGQKIPLPVVPGIALPKRGDASGHPSSHLGAIQEILRNYKCPKCGALASEHGLSR
jgi:predicted RNA-binding Zn-ribbon protein involved in translation (DUF1610 family)